jgi:hypothetical protein
MSYFYELHAKGGIRFLGANTLTSMYHRYKNRSFKALLMAISFEILPQGINISTRNSTELESIDVHYSGHNKPSTDLARPH